MRAIMYRQKGLILIMVVCFLGGILGIGSGAVMAVGNDVASSSVARYPVIYNDVNGVNLFNDIGRYQYQLFGNSNTVGYDEGNATSRPFYEYIDKDNDPSTYNSTSMDYIPQGRVIKAYLYLAQSYDVVGLQNANPTRDNAFILGPQGDRFYFDDGYQDAYYDITGFIQQQGGGTYWGKNIDSERTMMSTRDNFANWEIVVIEENDVYNYRQLSLQGYNLRMLNATRILNASPTPFATPRTDITGQAILSAGGGNSTIFSGSAYINSLEDGNQIGQSLLPTGVRGADLLQGRITDNGSDLLDRNPNRIPANIDLLAQTIDSSVISDGANNLQLQLTTANDAIFLHMLGIAVDIGKPNITLNSFIQTEGTTDSYFQIGDEVTISGKITPDPLEDTFFLHTPVIKIQLPSNTKYVDNSVQMSGATVGNIEYDSATGILQIHLATPVTNSPIGYSYRLETRSGMTVSSIDTSLSGYNEVQGDATDFSLSYTSNQVSLYPSYPVTINFINQNTNKNLSQKTLTGNHGEGFGVLLPYLPGFSFNEAAENSAMNGVFSDVSQVLNFYYLPNVYTLQFDLRGGNSQVPDPQQVEFGGLAIAVSNPTRTGHTFLRWNTLADGTGIEWDFAGSKMPAEDITLYAQWDVNRYTLEFNLNGGGGSAPENQKVEFGKPIAVIPDPIRSGYIFKGWNTQADGQGEKWNFETSTMPAKALTLYAQWERAPIMKTGEIGSNSTDLLIIMLAMSGVLLGIVAHKKNANKSENKI